MTFPPDYHMHTPLCRHAVGQPREYAAHAALIGLEGIGFSDHSPMSRDNFDDWRMCQDELEEYVESVRAAQRDFPQLRIRLALEVDYLPGQEEWIRDLASRHPWDYFIGSVHYVSGGWVIDNPKQLSQWRDRDAYAVWTDYFDRLTQAAHSGLFEVIGHCDLPKKFGFVPERDCTHLFIRFLEAVRTSGCALELNTAGLRKDCREIYPSRQILELAFQQGVPITFGSDAHAPREVGMNFAEALQLAQAVGYTECCTFAQRTRTMVKL